MQCEAYFRAKQIHLQLSTLPYQEKQALWGSLVPIIANVGAAMAPQMLSVATRKTIPKLLLAGSKYIPQLERAALGTRLVGNQIRKAISYPNFNMYYWMAGFPIVSDLLTNTLSSFGGSNSSNAVPPPPPPAIPGYGGGFPIGLGGNMGGSQLYM